MSKKTKNYDIFALIRFIVSIVALLILAIVDLEHDGETIPNIIYLLIGGLNGVDAYKLYNDIKKDYDDSSNE